jgi:hypothetical protein
MMSQKKFMFTITSCGWNRSQLQRWSRNLIKTMERAQKQNSFSSATLLITQSFFLFLAPEHYPVSFVFSPFPFTFSSFYSPFSFFPPK